MEMLPLPFTCMTPALAHAVLVHAVVARTFTLALTHALPSCLAHAVAHALTHAFTLALIHAFPLVLTHAFILPCFVQSLYVMSLTQATT